MHPFAYTLWCYKTQVAKCTPINYSVHAYVPSFIIQVINFTSVKNNKDFYCQEILHISCDMCLAKLQFVNSFRHDVSTIDTSLFMLTRHISYWLDTVNIDTSLFMLTRLISYCLDTINIDVTFYIVTTVCLLTRHVSFWHDKITIDAALVMLTLQFVHWHDTSTFDP